MLVFKGAKKFLFLIYIIVEISSAMCVMDSQAHEQHIKRNSTGLATGGTTGTARI